MEKDDEITSIEITKGTRRRLRVWKAERDLTYDEAIVRLVRLSRLIESRQGEEEEQRLIQDAFNRVERAKEGFDRAEMEGATPGANGDEEANE